MVNKAKKVFLKIEQYGNLTIMKLNRPKKLNALNSDFIEELQSTFLDLEKDENVRGIILTGVGSSFIVGADITEMGNLDSQTGIQFISRLHELMKTIRYLRKPVVAGVNGYCYGAGLELAVSCDLVIASDSATFGMQEVKIGIPSVIEASLLPFVIGLNNTKELLLTGEVIDSRTARNMGMVNHVEEDEALLMKAIEYTLRITNNPAHSVHLQKQLINRWLENAGLEQSIKNGIDSFGLAFTYSDTNEILKNHLTKN